MKLPDYSAQTPGEAAPTTEQYASATQSYHGSFHESLDEEESDVWQLRQEIHWETQQGYCEVAHEYFEAPSGLDHHHVRRMPADIPHFRQTNWGINEAGPIDAVPVSTRSWPSGFPSNDSLAAINQRIIAAPPQNLTLSPSPNSNSLHSSSLRPRSVASDFNISDDDEDDKTGLAKCESDSEVGDYIGSHDDNSEPLVETFCPFGELTPGSTLHDSKGKAVEAEIRATFTKAYLEDSTDTTRYHITYRRNYFAVATSYTLSQPAKSANGKLYLHERSSRYFVRALAVRMRAVKSDGGEEVPICMFTAKRGPPISPTPLLQQDMQPDMDRDSKHYADSTGHGSDVRLRPIFHTFQRLQFRKATENNGVRRRGQSFYRIVVELRALIIGKTNEDEWVTIASKMSGPLLVRGRCPNSFEPYNPENRKRKPLKRKRERSQGKSTQSKGIVKHKPPGKKPRFQNSNENPQSNHDSPQRSMCSDASALHTVTSGFQNPLYDTSAPFPLAEPSLMAPTDHIPLQRRLPLPSENAQLPTEADHSMEDSLLSEDRLWELKED